MATTFDQIPFADQQTIERMIKDHLDSMSRTEQDIRARTYSSLAHYVAAAIRSIAAFLGYVIALPLAYAELVVNSFSQGWADGWNAAFKSVRDI